MTRASPAPALTSQAEGGIRRLLAVEREAPSKRCLPDLGVAFGRGSSCVEPLPEVGGPLLGRLVALVRAQTEAPRGQEQAVAPPRSGPEAMRERDPAVALANRAEGREQREHHATGLQDPRGSPAAPRRGPRRRSRTWLLEDDVDSWRPRRARPAAVDLEDTPPDEVRANHGVHARGPAGNRDRRHRCRALARLRPPRPRRLRSRSRGCYRPAPRPRRDPVRTPSSPGGEPPSSR